MNSKIKNICIFSSSSNTLDKIYYEHARLMGELIGKSGYNLVYGGSKLGLMFSCASAAKENGSKILGIMPRKLYGLGESEAICDDFIITDGMRERKGLLDEKSDALIALPGGFGTLEELSEMIVQKQLCYNNKAIVLLNTNGFYDELLKFFENIVFKKFADVSAKTIYYVASTPQEAIEYINGYSENFEEERKQFLSEHVFGK